MKLQLKQMNDEFISPDIAVVTASKRTIRTELIFSVSYFFLYLIYLFKFIHLENEITHWLTLVLIPFIFLFIIQKQDSGKNSITSTLATIGLNRQTLRNGLVIAVAAGGLLGLVQIGFSDKSDKILAAFSSGRFMYAFPLGFLIMFLTAGFTEEFFFRGILQTKLTETCGSKAIGVFVSAFFFGLYHLPYAYLLKSWPSHGNLTAALSEGVLMTAVIGLLIGLAYARYQNLLVPIVIHSMMNAFWAMVLFM